MARKKFDPEDPRSIAENPPNLKNVPLPPYDPNVNHCHECEFFVEWEKAREQMKRENWWEHVFRGFDDGHDFKPYHIGDPSHYSICDARGVKCHFAAPACEKFVLRKTIAKAIMKK